MQDMAGITEKEVEIDFVSVGKRIKKARKLRRMTQDDLASICNCSSNHLSAIENGVNKPSLEMMMKISVALDKCLDYFLTGSSHVSKAFLIDDQIIEKLNKCDIPTLKLVNDFIDKIQSYRENYIHND